MEETEEIFTPIDVPKEKERRNYTKDQFKASKKHKEIFLILFAGGHITLNAKYGIRIKDKNHNPLSKATNNTFLKLRHFLRKRKTGSFVYYVLKKSQVPKLRKNNWVRMKYNELNKKQ